MNRRTIGWIAAGLAAALLGACGGAGDDRSKAKLRLVNASTYAGLDLLVDDARLLSAVTYGQGAGYVEVDPAKMNTSLTRPGSSTALVSLTPAVVKRKFYTLLAYGDMGALKVAALDDNTAAADSGKSFLRVFNGAVDAGTLDVYLTAEADPLADAVALHAGAAVGTATPFATVNSGTWRLRVTGPGAKADLRLDLRGIVLGSTQVLTVVLTPGIGGVLVNTLLLVQEGSVTARANAQARVRVAAAVPNSGSVSVALGNQVLMNSVGAPALGDYVLVPAGEVLASVTVDGLALGTTTVTLPAGAERTLLVHNPAGTARTNWIEDDNRLPATSGKAKLRLVHGMAGATGSLAMTADGLPVAGGIAAGAASAYVEVNPGTLVDLVVTAVGSSAPVVTLIDQTLVAGSVYSVFVVAGPTPPVALLRRDR